jgi:hypothetical protein
MRNMKMNSPKGLSRQSDGDRTWSFVQKLYTLQLDHTEIVNDTNAATIGVSRKGVAFLHFRID